MIWIRSKTIVYKQRISVFLRLSLLEMAMQSNSRNRLWERYPEMGTVGHRMRRIAHVCTTWFESANRCPSFWHRRQTQALKRKTRHVRRFRNVSVPLPVPVPFLCRIYKMPSHQASSFLHQNPQPTARSCCPPAYECFILGKHTARNGVAGISPPRREFQKC